jgi:light-independent protochlorophyllide reductase subunit B
MQLALWTYEGPPHVGAMRIATALRGVHLVLHAPQGDTYADLLFTMIQRSPERPPVSYTTFQARDLGQDTAARFQGALAAAWERFRPQALLVAASCTAELLQDDPRGLSTPLGLPVPVIPLELPAYQRKEGWGASETFYQVVRALSGPPQQRPPRAGRPARCNLLGPSSLGFRERDDLREVQALLERMGVDIAVVAPLGASPADLARLPEADFNVVLVPETARAAAQWLQRVHGQPHTTRIPIGERGTRAFIEEVAALAGIDPGQALAAAAGPGAGRAGWYARSVDANYLAGKRVFIFGDATHAVAAADVAVHEFGFDLAGLGTYSREFAREVREAAARHGVEPLVTDDHLTVEAAIAAAAPDLVLGTQMERHIAKRLGLPCAVISAPVHVQDFPARHAPQMGHEGANVLFDSWVAPLMMGLEEHLLGMFRDDFEFHADAPASHLGASIPGHQADTSAPLLARQAATPGERGMLPQAEPDIAARPPATLAPPRAAPGLDGAGHPVTVAVAATAVVTPAAAAAATVTAAAVAPTDATAAEADAGPRAGTQAPTADPAWAPEAEKELRKVPFFVRAKARRNTERYAHERQLPLITVETLYDAKAHFSR